jgi:hypothetical protein
MAQPVIAAIQAVSIPNISSLRIPLPYSSRMVRHDSRSPGPTIKAIYLVDCGGPAHSPVPKVVHSAISSVSPGYILLLIGNGPPLIA